jgi:hypothetical protein
MSRHYLYVHKPAIILTGTIAEDVTVYPVDTVQVTDLSGAITDALPGMTVVFGSAAGNANLGRQRIRKPGDGSSLFIGRSGRGRGILGDDGGRDGEVFLHAGDHFTVWDDFRVWSKIPRFLPLEDDGVRILKDSDIEVGDHMNEPPPKANANGPTAGTIDPGTAST